MSGRGRGRGRGRGLPINYPDGWAPKPAGKSPYPELQGEELPKALRVCAADKEVLSIARRLRSTAASKSFVVPGARKPQSAPVRYSDRYLEAPTVPFSQSEMLTMKPNLHFPRELLPPPKVAKRARAGSSSADTGRRGLRQQQQPKRSRLVRGSDLAGDPGRFADPLEEEVEEEGEEGEEGVSGAEEEQEEEEEEPEDYGAAGYGDEDGMDDMDSGGDDDEPVY